MTPEADVLSRLAGLEVPAEDLAFRDTEALRDWLYSLEGVEVTRVGHSRDRQEMFGLRFGEGNRNVSIVAGSHADEPVGPMTAQALGRVLRRAFPELLEHFRFHIVPQMNPDGAEVNRSWFGTPFELDRYLNSVVRELPGDDIEFGWGTGPSARPENANAMRYLAPNAPYEAHFSLHGMGFAEGAWCLLSPEWIDRAGPYMRAFETICGKHGMPLHDVDRGGEKGFVRIKEGFTTHPNSEAMKAFFREQGDHTMANRFRPSSMEWVRAQGGDPFCVVSELPLFRVGKRNAQFRQELTELRAKHATLGPEHLAPLVRAYSIEPVDPAEQVPLQIAMVVLALTHALPDEPPYAEPSESAP